MFTTNLYFLTPKELLYTYWGYDSFLFPQNDIIESILQGKDTLAILPTGGGKSLCYQIPALVLDGLTLVISPLIALMKDQTTVLQKKGISAEFISNELTENELYGILERAREKKIKLLYVSPERVQSKQFIQQIKDVQLQLIAVDEAHCVSEWGHDFRPAYHQIASIRNHFPKATLLALTATATNEIQKEIIDRLALQEPAVFKTSLKRSNLAYQVHSSVDKKADLVYFLKKHPGSSIVFVRSRKQTFELARFLSAQGFDADYFHAKLSKEEKEQKQLDWTESPSRIMVSTNAFGMGIDKPNVRTVFHLSLPSGIEAYYQEVGRAGRDGNAAHGIYLYHEDDCSLQEDLFKAHLPTKKEFLKITQALFSFLQVGEGEWDERVYNVDLALFSEKFDLKPRMVVNYLDFLAAQQMIYKSNYSQNSSVKIRSTPSGVLQIEEPIVDYLQRHYPGIYTDYTPISESQIAYDLRLSITDIRSKLIHYAKNGVLAYTDRYSIRFSFLKPRNTAEYSNRLWNVFEKIQQTHWKRLQAMVYFAQQTSACRERLILAYFNEKSENDCGQCDLCLKKKEKSIETNADLLTFIKGSPKTLEQILSNFITLPKEKIMYELQFLIDELEIEPVGVHTFKRIEK